MRSSNDVWLMQLSDRKPLRVTNTPFVETDGRISPDGRWIAYQSNEAGVTRPVDVYLQSLSGLAYPRARSMWQNAESFQEWRGAEST